MKEKIVRVIAQTVCVCMLALVTDGCGDSRPQRLGQPLEVDVVIEHPEKFTGPIAVAGRVAKVEPASGVFMLGCEDGCVLMPVKFAGTLPAAGRDVIARGQVKQTAQGNYVFNAQTVEQK